MAQRRNERVIGSQLAGLVVPYAQELRDLGVDEPLLRELSELTGGSALGEPRETFVKARRQSRINMEIWPWMVGIVAVMLLPEIAVRRLGSGAVGWLASALGRRRRSGETGGGARE